MSVAYRQIIAATGLRINALVGATATALQAAYVTSPLTTAEFQSTIFPFAAVTEAVLNGEQRLVQKVANNAEDPLRQYLADVTGTLTNPSTMPSVSTNTKPIIGIWGAVRNVTTGATCSKMPLDVVRRRAGSSLNVPVDWFDITGGRIEHTCDDGVIVECCVYSRTTQATALAANGDILLSDALEPDYINEAVAILVRDDEFMSQAKLYAERASNSLVGSLTTLDGVAATT